MISLIRSMFYKLIYSRSHSIRLIDPLTEDSIMNMVPILCKVVKRHDIHHEPTELKVISPGDKTNPNEEVDFVVLYGDPDEFLLSNIDPTED